MSGRPRWRRVAAASALAVAATMATGCANETQDYCDSLEESTGTLAELAAGGAEDQGTLDRTVEVLTDLRDDAPGDIEDEWSALVFAYDGLADAFDRAGVAPEEYDPAAPPAGVSEEDAERIEGAAAQLRSLRVLDAARGLEQHARDVCKVDLGLASG